MDERLSFGLIGLAAIIGVLLAPFIQPPWVFSILVILISIILALIRMTRYSAIGIIILALLYGIGLLPLVIFLSTFVIIIFGEAAFRLAKATYPYLAYILTAFSGTILIMLYLGELAALVAILGVTVALLLKTALKKRRDARMITTLGVGFTMYLFAEIHATVQTSLLLVAVIIAFTFGYSAYRAKSADLSGLFSGALMGILLIVFADVRWFLIMLAFFIIGSGLTRYKFSRKTDLGVAESHGGVRGYMNVFANGLVSVAAAILFGITGNPVFIAMYLGSVAAAAADTTASEVGVVGKQPYLITTFKPVPRGTDGGITAFGTFAAILSALAISIVALLLNVADPAMVIIGTLAGLAGTTVDSLVGATLERSGRLGNSGTNFFCTLTGGLVGLILYALWIL